MEMRPASHLRTGNDLETEAPIEKKPGPEMALRPSVPTAMDDLKRGSLNAAVFSFRASSAIVPDFHRRWAET
jgi:hypothetical protein